MGPVLSIQQLVREVPGFAGCVNQSVFGAKQGKGINASLQVLGVEGLKRAPSAFHLMGPRIELKAGHVVGGGHWALLPPS